MNFRQKSGLLAAVLLSALPYLMTPASAADLPRPAYKAPAYIPTYFSWTGFYIGAHAGYGWTKLDSGLGGVGSSIDLKGFLGGGQLGYNYQIGQFVLGVEGEYSFADVKYSTALFAGEFKVKNDYFADVAARIGYAFDRTLIYGKVGYAWSRNKYDITDGLGGTASGDFSRKGLLLGAGAEYAFLGNWSAKLEYNYINFGSNNELPTVTNAGPGALTVVCITDCNVKSTSHLVKAGINYRF